MIKFESVYFHRSNIRESLSTTCEEPEITQTKNYEMLNIEPTDQNRHVNSAAHSR